MFSRVSSVTSRRERRRHENSIACSAIVDGSPECSRRSTEGRSRTSVDRRPCSSYGGSELALATSGSFDFSEGWKRGLSIGVGLGYSFLPAVSVLAILEHNRFPPDEENQLGALGGSIDGGVVRITTLSANLRISIVPGSQSISPYVQVGVGALSYADVKSSARGPGFTREQRTTTSGLAQDASLHLGGGVDIPAGKSSAIFLEGRLVVALVERDSFVPVRGGIRLKL